MDKNITTKQNGAEQVAPGAKPVAFFVLGYILFYLTL
jgi:hypothetical protein